MTNSIQRRTVTVVMPVRDEAGYIERTLEAVLRQDYPSELVEVIVADGMSTDGTREIVERSSRQSGRVRMIDNPRKIASTALNLAIAKARGDIIIRVDGHCEIASDYVSRCVFHLESGVADCVGGPLDTVGDSYWARVIASAMSSKFGVGGAAFRTVKGKSIYVDTVAFPALKRQTIERAGPFTEELVRNQDDEFSYRLRGLGFRILMAHDVRCRYYSRSSIPKLGRQYFQYGLYKVRVMQMHPKCMQVRQFVPATFVGALLLSLAACAFPYGWVLGAAILAMYTSAIALATFLCVAKNGWHLAAGLPVAFVTLHLGYGCGFLLGLVRFRFALASGPERAMSASATSQRG